MQRLGPTTFVFTIVIAIMTLLTVGGKTAEALTREQALAALGDREDVTARRHGAEALGEVGLMADAPLVAQALRDPDEGVRTLAEETLWQIWSRSGDPEIDALFLRGVEQLQHQELTEAIATFTDVIKRKPEFAEGWNKRATAYYFAGEFEKSLADCGEVMKRNPAHFGALSGYGLIYLQLGKPEEALSYFERALAVNPNLADIEHTAQAIKQVLEQQRKDST
jgi:tetratricopeptide (TPR) repeat protein